MTTSKSETGCRVHQSVMVRISELKEHPRNYRSHPDDQVEHLQASIRDHGFYRNVVIARDGTILAGHGVVEAARRSGLIQVSAVRLDVEADSPAAIKLLIGDNEIEHLAEQDDRALTELLKEISGDDLEGLLGTGYDDAMLANLAFVTRPESEIEDRDAAKEWVGMPEYDPDTPKIQLTISFESEEDRSELMRIIGVDSARYKNRGSWSIRWPDNEKEDLSSLRYESDNG